ncbi:sulfite exporter TauE/SafE family protein [Colwellia sp. 1_MG-2023]|uniref:sulfite exporter TauE/SafE family protein n=1 Tax=unclassified Colwellia TaxID=196834 RepID=UPI001C08B31A|nr:MULTISPECIES: sulfite exporter TauE/SafE family protein [unclassified Colwellia]MBU2924320.1 sulfite exporter TauE/SafE family protein [Colwellia sp. C2M11]MDO6650878.1 sulfite exporter TauE/SafE family protein [Colwellia sp. 3_MG-2023]MDO6663913.1 sulfite exporter TauE/SafE family protein [Colwellia sp. 2_MG-2023]MDO6688264.1 sulfite exporter TauE/SafE family protein [Colwellia sp. 1_MG-2023]
MNLDLFSAFVIGLLGSGHCIVMCGGITTMLTSALPESNKYNNQIPVNNQRPIKHSTASSITRSKTALVILYNIGRISSYAFIGAIVGFTGSIAAKNIGMPLAGLRLISATFMILLGLYLGQWLMWLNRIEALGKHLWRYISPLASKAIPVNSPIKALTLGAIWGWLPCGLVYSTLTWALASGSIYTGASIMFFFGLGTLPALLTLSIGFSSIKNTLTKPSFKKVMALVLITFGIYSFIVAYHQMF